MRKISSALTCAALWAGLSAGCAERPIVIYEPRVEFSHLAADVDAADNEYHLFSAERTAGRFGAGVAIAKLVPDREATDVNLRLTPMRPAEEAHWGEILRNVAPIREPQFLDPISLRPATPSVAALCAEAAARRLPILLVYTPNRYGPNAAQVIGVVYDTEQCTPLATLHASAMFVDDDGQEVDLDEQTGDQRRQDAYYQASREFEQHFLACMAELISLDAPAPTTQPHRWRKPLRERWWLPERD